jgi:hypothetical protein
MLPIPDVKITHIFGSMIGAVVGYGLIVTSDMFKVDTHREVALDPTPEAFSVDPQSYTLFKSLECHKRKNPKAVDAYADMVHSIDSIFHIETVIARIGSKFGDRSISETHFSKFRKATARFQDAASAKSPSKDIIQLEEDCEKVLELAKHHLNNIYSLTDSV